MVLPLHGQGSNFIFRPKGIYGTMCHDFLAHFVVLGSAGMSELISSWRPMMDKRRDIPSRSPLEDDQVFRRCLLTICVLFEAPWCGARVHCLVRPHLRPSGVHTLWCWRDTRVGALIRFCTLSVVLVLVCLPACGVQETGSVSLSALRLVRKWSPVGLLGDDFRKLSSYSRQSTEPF